MQIKPIPTLQDNYVWAIMLPQLTIIVDPGASNPVIDFLEKQQRYCNYILLTHHHQDHTGGVEQLLHQYPNAQVFGPKIQNLNVNITLINAQKNLSLHSSIAPWQVLKTPGHTLDHVCYYHPGILLCGDTLFSAGCGRIFEGTYLQMYQSLQQIARLPDQTNLYPAHEYTQQNLTFSTYIEPENTHAQHALCTAKAKRSKCLPTVPTTLAIEKKINPFLRCHHAHIKARITALTGNTCINEIETFRHLRELRNKF